MPHSTASSWATFGEYSSPGLLQSLWASSPQIPLKHKLITWTTAVTGVWGCLELPGDGWTCEKGGLRWVAGLGTAGIQVHVEIPLVCSWLWELWEALLALACLGALRLLEGVNPSALPVC